MNKNKNAIALFLMLAMTISLFALPIVNAQEFTIYISAPAEGLVNEPLTIRLEVRDAGDLRIEHEWTGVTLGVRYPGRAWVYLGPFDVDVSGRLDQTFTPNVTGTFQFMWIVPPQLELPPNPATSDETWRSDIGYTEVGEYAERETYAFIGATPNPVGIGQETLLHIGITQQLTEVQMGWEGLSVTITKPDGTSETIGGIRTDATGGTGRVYVPTIVGNYTLQTHYPEQGTTVHKRAGGTPVGTVMLASDSQKLTLAVTEEPIPTYPGSPLPTEYWTRPIDANLHEWAVISGNWLMDPPNLYALYNDDAPETAHVLWAKPLTTGGLAGGLIGRDNLAHQFECGDAYEGKFSYSVIIGGVLYYNRFTNPERGGLPSQGIVAVDLHTGEELWFRNNTSLNLGQAFYWDSYNYHGVFPYLWELADHRRSQTAGGTWNIYDAFTGEWVYTMTDVPSGTNIIGPNGEILRYTVDVDNGWMTQWNSTRAVNPQNYGATIGQTTWDGSWARNMGRDGYNRVYPAERGIEWNATIPMGLPGSAYLYNPGDRVVGVDYSSLTEVTIWALSLKSGQEGTLLFKNTWKAPADWIEGNQSISRAAGSIDDDLITLWSKETQRHWGFSTETGKYLWGPTAQQNYLDYLGLRDEIAYGKLYSQGMSGILYCYDAKTGELLWTYSADDPYNQVLWSNQWNIRPVIIADGKIYMGNSEHSPIDPKPRGGPFVCVNATTGEEIWRVDGMFRQTDWGGRAVIGDSIIATMDTYDQRVYAIGKGPSATMVTAPDIGVTLGKSVLVQGMVTDVSPGTEEYALTARFPNGVPAVSDANMSEWMLYVYKQIERPADAVGVEVIVSVIDPNNNCYEVGRTTSDASGAYGLAFTPEVPGKYTVIASFEGSGAYYGSFAETFINVEEAPAATPEPTPMPASAADLYFVPAIIGIIVAIIVVGFLLFLLLRKR